VKEDAEMKRNIMTLALAITLAAAANGAGQSTEPPAGPPRDFTLPQQQTITLDNGLVARLVPFGNIPKVTLGIFVRAGNINEQADEVWLADLTGNYFKEGAGGRSAEEVALAFAGMGGDLDVNVGMDLTQISTDVLSDFAPDAVRLLADVVRTPAFPETELDRLVNDLARQLSIAQSNPSQLALAAFRKALYGDHPYGRFFPTEEILRAFSMEDVRRFHADNFGASRTRVYVVGRFDADEVEAAIREAFADWPAGPDKLINIPESTSQRAIHIADRPGAPQSAMRLGLPVVDQSNPDYVPLMVTNTLLGGFFSSRITTNIREDKGYTYSPYSSVSTRYRDAYWLQQANVSTEVTAPALKEIFFEIDRLQEEAPTAGELDGIKAYMAGVFVLQNSSRNGITNQLAILDLHGLDADFLSTYVSKINAVTPEGVRKIAATYLKDEEMTIAIAGDRSQIAASLAPFGQIID
jgi:predicted Zn-dependent peptidase